MSTPDIRNACDEGLARLKAAHPLDGTVLLFWMPKPEGTAWSSFFSRTMVLNENELTAGSLDFWLDAVRHEYAHFLAWERGAEPDEGHSERWGGAARELGVPESDIKRAVDIEAAFRSGQSIIRGTWGPCEYCGAFAPFFCSSHGFYFCIECPGSSVCIEERIGPPRRKNRR